ncbi:hypothetical protein K6U06_08995 [Acidiferrimicrobium sp. IK]|uniref:hypothetical protein n=1 Tax=Acidiferrimicrobium sp. IK TaxID=2871700 RepID=UPI0021CB2628|nr:hypothetical protein [Acidiferrimicrobium sp. IK]MCU4184496.1 hypothetical protein [Acidiferrimicrobium sp. IK]
MVGDGGAVPLADYERDILEELRAARLALGKVAQRRGPARTTRPLPDDETAGDGAPAARPPH